MDELLKPQLCQPTDRAILDDIEGLQPYICERKFDGTRIIAYVENGKTLMYTRNGKTEVAHKYSEISDKLSEFDNTILDGELVFVNANNHIEFQSALITPETAFIRGLRPCYVVFDVLRTNGIDVSSEPLFLRREKLSDIGITSNNIMLSEVFEQTNTFKQIFENEIAIGGEGIVLKKMDGQYLFGKRKEWLKVKRQDTCDGVIMGITEGEGKFKDTFGALIVGDVIDGKLKVIAYCSGMDDATRKWMYDTIMSMPEVTYPNKFGKPVLRLVAPTMAVELEYMEQTEYGFLRHPRFLRIRDDKTIDVPVGSYKPKEKVLSIFDF